MEESAVPSIWASMNSWFTPTLLFIFLNLIIATILFTSNFPNNNNQQQEDQNQNQNQSKHPKSPSILHRLRSLNLYPHKSQQQQSVSANPNYFDLNPTRFDEQSNKHELQPVSANTTRFDFKPTRFVEQSDEHELQSVSANQIYFDLNPTHFDEQSNEHALRPVFANPTRFDKQSDEQDLQPVSANPNSFDLDPTRLDKQTNAQTHFVYEQNYTIEKVISHFDFGPGPTGVENKNPVLEHFVNKNDELKSLDEIYSNITGGHFNRAKSDTKPSSGDIPVKLPAKMKKSASLKSAFSHFEEEKIVEARRPATVRERSPAAADDDDVEVDAKADDFINKFKHQLKLQRMDSIIRYKGIVNRGDEK